MLAAELWLVTVRGYVAVIFLSKQCSILISFRTTCASRNVQRRDGAIRDFTGDSDAREADEERERKW